MSPVPDEASPPARRPTVTCLVGGVPLGSAHPVVVQSMTNTDTADVEATAGQAAALAAAGSELVRVTVNRREAALAVPAIRRRLDEAGVRVPLVGDFHYNGHQLLAEHPECAAALDKYRINPGNVGVGDRHDGNFRRMVEAAVEHGKPVRIGVNWGSLDRALLTARMDANALLPRPRPEREVRLEVARESALRSAELAERCGLPHDRIVLSVKVSEVADLVAVNRALAAACDHPLHLGLTEAGPGMKGTVASASALAILLAEGIGDTVRVSLTPTPGGDRAEEVRVAQQVLQSLGLRRFAPQVTSCPGCGRTTSTLYQELAAKVADHLRERAPRWRRDHPGAEGLRVAVMGCVVNGPGESRHADIGISLPGAGEDPRAPVFVDGRLAATLRGETLAADFLRLLDEYVAARFGKA